MRGTSSHQNQLKETLEAELGQTTWFIVIPAGLMVELISIAEPIRFRPGTVWYELNRAVRHFQKSWKK